MLEPTHQIVVASNIALTNQLDVDRKRLHRAFYALFWALLGIGAGGALLVLRLVTDFKRAQQLAGHLIELNATLEKRVGERTRQLSEGKALLHFILEASPSDVVLLSACSSASITSAHACSSAWVARPRTTSTCPGCSPAPANTAACRTPWRRAARWMAGKPSYAGKRLAGR